MSAGSAALAPKMVPTIAFVKGSSKMIKIMKGIERNTLTTAATNEWINRFSHMFPFDVKNNKRPKIIPRKNVANTETAVI